MRKEVYRMAASEAVALFARVPYVHVATTNAAGEPLLRTVHGVVLHPGGDAPPYVAFHAAPAGEKMEALGRAAVVGAEEIVAEIPSWFLDAERACPATTYYRSAQAHGVVEIVEDPAEKAAVLRALMDKLQPEGRHVPIDAAHPLYAKAIRGLLVARISLARIDGKAKLGQNRTLAERRRVVALLRERGRAGDTAAADLLESTFPELAT